EVVRLAEAHLPDHVDEEWGSGELLVGQAALLEGRGELVAALVLRVLAPLAGEPGADLVAGPSRPHELEPVTRGTAALLGGQRLDDVTAAQLVVERDDLAVHLRPDAAVADVGVDRVGEVEGRRAGRQV